MCEYQQSQKNSKSDELRTKRHEEMISKIDEAFQSSQGTMGKSKLAELVGSRVGRKAFEEAFDSLVDAGKIVSVGDFKSSNNRPCEGFRYEY